MFIINQTNSQLIVIISNCLSRLVYLNFIIENQLINCRFLIDSFEDLKTMQFVAAFNSILFQMRFNMAPWVLIIVISALANLTGAWIVNSNNNNRSNNNKLLTEIGMFGDHSVKFF